MIPCYIPSYQGFSSPVTCLSASSVPPSLCQSVPGYQNYFRLYFYYYYYLQNWEVKHLGSVLECSSPDNQLVNNLWALSLDWTVSLHTLTTFYVIIFIKTFDKFLLKFEQMIWNGKPVESWLEIKLEVILSNLLDRWVDKDTGKEKGERWEGEMGDELSSVCI